MAPKQGPAAAVVAAFEGGAVTLDDVARETGLNKEMVAAVVARLREMGRIEAKELSTGCPSGGCGSCASGRSDGTAGCGAAGPSSSRSGPVLVQLRLRPPS